MRETVAASGSDLFGVTVRPHRRRRPSPKPDTRLLLADALSVLAAMGAPRNDDVARRYYGVRARLKQAVQQ